MKILIIGAGVLGSNLAHSLKKNNEITILARNKTYENLKNNGLIIKHKLKRKTVDHFNIINKLSDDDIYDVIFVVSRCSSLNTIIPNIDSVCLNKITIGRTDGKNDDDEFIKSIFEKTKVKVEIENKMNDYLKTHGCAILPLVFACYKVDGNLKLLKRDKEYSLLIMDAIIEGYDVLKKLGYEILPKGEYENCTNKKNFCAFIYRFLFSNFLGKMCLSDHAMSAKEEFILMENEFEQLKKKAGIETKVYDELKLSLLNYEK